MNLPRRFGFREAVIVGVGVTPQGKLPNSTGLSLAMDAFVAALDDAGLDKSQIDGLVTEPATTNFGWALDYLRTGEALGLNPRYALTLMQGGSSANALVQSAILAIEAGLTDTVACVFGDAAKTDTGLRSTDAAHGSDADNFASFGLLGAMGWSALATSRHMGLYGTTPEQLGEVAVAARAFASLNPEAVMRSPITLSDYAESRMIIEPLRLLDSCLITDGGVCIILTTSERARDLRRAPVRVAGFGQSFTTQKLEHPEWWYGPHQKHAVDDAYRMANVTSSDVTVAQLYDNFTISTVTWLEHAGFCGVGEGGSYIEDVGIGAGAAVPVNTHGGHLSAAHPEGWLTLAEGVRQVRGDATGFQAPNTEVCLVTGRGMLLNCASAMVLTS